MKITIVGTGNVATALAKGFYARGLEIWSIFGRNADHACALAAQVGARPTQSLDFEREDLVILAISDDALETVAPQIRLRRGAWVLHTSGTKGLEVFGTIEAACGVFYPLQSFTKGRLINWSSVLFLTESNDRYLQMIMKSLAERLGAKASMVNQDIRRQLHLSAVFACNFSNLMLCYAQDILKEKGIDFEILRPLVMEAMAKAFDLGALPALTGPARRRDWKTMQSHLNLLPPVLQELYELLSMKIIEKTSY